MNIMTKFGKEINRATYEHTCDTVEDLKNIPEDEITLGSVAIVLNGSNGLEVYMSNSNKEWIKV